MTGCRGRARLQNPQASLPNPRVRWADLGVCLSETTREEAAPALARSSLGVSADLDDHELSVFYRLQLPRDRDEAVEHILGLSHAFSVE